MEGECGAITGRQKIGPVAANDPYLGYPVEKKGEGMMEVLTV
jgi:hypothetical protein